MTYVRGGRRSYTVTDYSGWQAGNAYFGAKLAMFKLGGKIRAENLLEGRFNLKRPFLCPRVSLWSRLTLVFEFAAAREHVTSSDLGP